MTPEAKHTSDEFLVFGAPAIEGPEIEEVVASLRSGWLSTGPKVHRFEREFARYKGADHAVAVNSCTAALHLSLLVAGVGPGDEVITTPMTFCATVNAIIHTGATPVLADIDPDTLNIGPARVEEKVTPRTRAVVPVHYTGYPCDMDALGDIAERHDLAIIEDCAHAIETEYKGRKVGTIGDFGCFSFYVTKNLVTGEGGMVLARREEDAERLNVLRLHGMSKNAWKRFGNEGYQHYQVVECGYKYNMMDLQAALGIHQLRRVESSWQRRRQIWQRYNQAFAGLPVELPPEPPAHSRHGLHLYTLRIDEAEAGVSRDEFLEAMTGQNIGVGVHYRAIPEHPYYQQAFGWRPEDYPHSVRVGRRTVSLPLSPALSDTDVDTVIRGVGRVLERRHLAA